MNAGHFIRMPLDWNDHDEWERYYQECLSTGSKQFHWTEVGSLSVKRLPGIVSTLKNQGWNTVWVPGCGLSPLPKLLCLLGLEVYATDISQTAIDFQKKPNTSLNGLTEGWDMTNVERGNLTCELHDFRKNYFEEKFDIIINVKAFQGFPKQDLKQIAQVHYKSLKPGRQAVFDTMNVQGERRDELEDALVNAGFFIYYYELNKWYRKVLRETGISHVFVLGQPIVPSTGEYANNKEKLNKDQEILRRIADDYKKKIEQEKIDKPDNAKIASMIYSTG
ncbi:MAG: class I SAM-dependent methyltransferase [Candidatus Hodarchaeota archaeon]